MIFYTNSFIPARFAAATRGPFIFIRPEYKEDKGLLEHEKVHRKQWLTTLGLHSLLYLFIPSYRLKSEIEAYSIQAKYCNIDKLPLFAKFIATKYNLDIKEEDALTLLRNYES